jgi:type I restriction enzyme R subunit
VNPEDKFGLVFRHLLERLFVERMDQNEEIFVRYMNDASFRDIVSGWMAEMDPGFRTRGLSGAAF